MSEQLGIPGMMQAAKAANEATALKKSILADVWDGGREGELSYCGACSDLNSSVLDEE